MKVQNCNVCHSESSKSHGFANSGRIICPEHLNFCRRSSRRCAKDRGRREQGVQRTGTRGISGRSAPRSCRLLDRGFTARQQPSGVHEAVQSMDLDGFAPSPSERPVAPKVDDRGKKTVARRSSARPTERSRCNCAPNGQTTIVTGKMRRRTSTSEQAIHAP